jgi:hypothetical protein
VKTLVVEQQRAVHDHERTSSNMHTVMLNRNEWEFLQNYRKQSATDQRLIFRALAGAVESAQRMPGLLH